MEMTAFMELLGGVLFLTAMGAGARLVALDTCNAICRLLFQSRFAAIVRPNASVPLKVVGYLHAATIAFWNLVLVLNCRHIASLNCAEYRA